MYGSLLRLSSLMNYLPGGFDGLQMVQEDVDDAKKGVANQE